MLHGLNLGVVSAQAAEFLIANSLRLNDDDSAYLTRTPSVAGNRKTWTFSAWFKPGDLGQQSQLLSAGTNGVDDTGIIYAGSSDSGALYLFTRTSSSTQGQIKTNAVFRDPSAWYHIVVVYDATNATAADRMQIYVNGVRQSVTTATTLPQNTDSWVNSTSTHYLFSQPNNAGYVDGLIALPQLVDGAALDYTSFAEFDANNFINPIEFNASAIDDTAPTVSYVSSAQNGTSQTTYTFSSQSIGTADTDRQVFVSISGKQASGSGLNISSCTIGGVTANVITEQQSSDATVVGWAYANVPTGTTGDIVVTFDAGASGAAIDVYRSVVANPVVWAANGAANNATSLTASINTPTSDGFILAAAGHTDSSNTGTVVWTGDVTEDADTNYDTDRGHSSASGTPTATSESVTVTWDGGSVVATNNALSVIHVSGRDGYGPNGFRLPFTDNSTAAALGTDDSGNGNDFTVSGITITDQLSDTPTDSSADGHGNFAHMDPNNKSAAVTLSNANTRVQASVGNEYAYADRPIVQKTYWEVQFTYINQRAGLAYLDTPTIDTDASSYMYYGNSGDKTNTTDAAYASAVTAGQWVGFSYDPSNGDFIAYPNGSSGGTMFTLSTSELWYPMVHFGNSLGDATFNFGDTAFQFTVPTGFTALATQNLQSGDADYVEGPAQYRAGIQIANFTLNANSGGNTGYTFRSQMPASTITDVPFTKFRCKLLASTAGDIDIDAIYIGTQASSGNAWDYAGDQVQLTVNGSGSFNIPTGVELWTDWVNFSGDGTDALVLGFDIGDTNGDLRYNASVSGASWHILAATDAAATTAPAGLSTTASYVALIDRIEVT